METKQTAVDEEEGRVPPQCVRTDNSVLSEDEDEDDEDEDVEIKSRYVHEQNRHANETCDE
ncbi:hypothetical protein Baya_15204 [Bagarius yarrelli]|uniref:Uncharacterized protein n=1 Tax=Bagarius yarrelli TaxID=175774 RepID=A0A556VB40_BAGYA|nr:hypothetical protein Baya_15204 [Bagarius yarrelli]